MGLAQVEVGTTEGGAALGASFRAWGSGVRWSFGTVTPGITGKLFGGNFDRSEFFLLIRKVRS